MNLAIHDNDFMQGYFDIYILKSLIWNITRNSKMKLYLYPILNH